MSEPEVVTRKATWRTLTLECGHTQRELIPTSGPKQISITCLTCRFEHAGNSPDPLPIGWPMRKIMKSAAK